MEIIWIVGICCLFYMGALAVEWGLETGREVKRLGAEIRGLKKLLNGDR